MFTGIVTGVGRIRAIAPRGRGARLELAPPPEFGMFQRGESVCVDGVCLTAVRRGRQLVADLSEETLRRSTLGALSPGDAVNLERALRWGDRLSGHFLLGHVDGIARVLARRAAGNSWTYRFSIPTGLARFVVFKGSVGVDGVSLTVAARRRGSFDVAIIPETLKRTTLSRALPGARVNFEVDVFARYGSRGWRRAVRPVRGR